MFSSRFYFYNFCAVRTNTQSIRYKLKFPDNSLEKCLACAKVSVEIEYFTCVYDVNQRLVLSQIIFLIKFYLTFNIRFAL